jgi:hypothetical protein
MYFQQGFSKFFAVFQSINGNETTMPVPVNERVLLIKLPSLLLVIDLDGEQEYPNH